ncbi:MAG TPA: SMP-30/gluconolactonase/LRE family protein [Anaeromyxobacteraceae bacterium]|nr:SMP-30/gluconolactonase/LRE family protein [Anaeromyxobacteraceae bacterium]
MSQTSVRWFVAVVPAGQGSLVGGTLLGDGSTQVAFTTGAASVAGAASWVLPPIPGTYTVTVSALNCASGSGSASATVTAAAQPTILPVIDSLVGSADRALAGKSLALKAAAHDPAGGSVTYAWSADAGTFSSATGSSTSWTAPGAAGQSTITLTVSNGQGTATASLPVTVALAEYQASFGRGGRAPRRVVAGASGELYVVDARSGDILRMTPNGQPVGALKVPDRMLAATFGKNVLYATSRSGGLYAIDPLGGPPRAIPLRSGALRMPSGVALDAGRGVLWIAESAANQITGIRLDGSTVAVITGAAGESLAGLDDVAVDAAGGVLWASVSSNEQGNNAFAFDLGTGAYLHPAAPYGSGSGQVTRTGGIAVDGAGRLFVSDIFQGRVAVYQRGGAAAGTVGQFGDGPSQLSLPAGVAVTPDGGILVASMDQGAVKRFGTGNPPPAQACTVNGSLDSDCDGMPDWWELKYGLNPYWAGDALLDADGDGLSNLQEYVLGTNPRVANALPKTTPQAPVLTVPAPRASDPGLVRFSTTLSSPTSCTVTWKQRLGPAVTLRGAGSLTPSFVGRLAGRYQFQGTAACGAQSATAVIEASIRNVAPRPDAGRLVVAHAGGRIVLDGRFSSDANADALRFVWDQTAGPALSGASTAATLPVKLRQPGYAAFQLTVADPAGKSGSAEAPVYVASDAAAPTAVASSPVVAATGAPVTLDASQSVDPAGTGTYAWVQVAGSPVALAGAATARPTFTPAAAGRYAFLVTISDGALHSPPALVEVLVGPSAGLPVAALAQASLQATVGEPVALDGGGSAASSGGGLQYAWRQVSGPAAGLTDADRAIATAVPFAPGVYVFELAVVEGGAPSQPARVTVTATSSTAGQGIPVAVAAGPLASTTGASISLDGTRSRDPDGHRLRYRWTQVAGPWVPLEDSTSSTPSFRPQLPGVYAFELEVDDLAIRSAAAPVSVTVSAPGGTP